MSMQFTYILVPLILILALISFIASTSFTEEIAEFITEAKISNSTSNSIREQLQIVTLDLVLLAIILAIIKEVRKKKLFTQKKLRDTEVNRLAIYLLIGILMFIGLVFFSNLAFKYSLSMQVDDFHLQTIPTHMLTLQRDIFVILQNFLTNKEIDIDEIDIPTYFLDVNQNNLDKLNSRLPFSGREYVPATLTYDNISYRAKVKYRGDSYSHWGSYKKSWRINLKNDTLVDSSERFNFVNSKFEDQLFPNSIRRIDENAGILVPRIKSAALFLNGKYFGVFSYVDQVDETFLRMKGLLPGDVYQGDLVLTRNGSVFTDAIAYQKLDLFSRPDVWTLEATYDGDIERATETLDYFIDGVNMQGDEFLEFFHQHLGDTYLRFLGVKNLLRDIHTNNKHNQKWYFDPSSGMFLPIAWDQIIGRIPESEIEALDRTTMRLDRELLKYPELIDRKNQFLYELITKYDKEQADKDVVRDAELIRYEIKHDTFKHTMQFPIDRYISNNDWALGVNKFRKNMQDNYNIALERLENASMIVYILNKSFVADVYGFSGVNVEGLGTLYPGRNLQGNVAKLATLRYEFDTDWNEKWKVTNSVTGSKVEPTFIKINKKDLPVETETISIHPNERERIIPKSITLSGIKILDKDLIIGKRDILEIAPGTAVYLKEGVSIISHGKIVAKGTKSKPIKLTAADKNPWGAVVLQGQDALGIFEHTTFEKGSGTNYRLVEYTGMLSVYNANASIKNSIFKDNNLVDDTLNAKNAFVDIIDSEFYNAFGDAIDYDISKGIISGTIIKNSRNDAIDLMTSNITIVDNYILGAGDKGISIGENSNPSIENNVIEDAVTGIAIKDLSNPTIYGNSISGSNTSISAYKKNWRYGSGGRGIFINNSFCNNKNKLAVDDHSEIKFQEDLKTITCMSADCDIKCQT